MPPLALLDEDGQRDPDQTPLTLLETSAPDDLAADVVDLPTDGAPEADLFAIGSTDVHAATVYPDQVNLEKQNGAWERIGLVAEVTGGWSGTFATGSLVFPARLSVETPVTVSFPEGTISSAPTNAVEAKPGSVTEDTVTYFDALPSTDFMYMLAPQGYKELILLKDKAAAGTISYSITAPGFDLRLEPTGEVSFLSQGVVVAVVPQPAVWDSSPSPVHTLGVYSVKPLGDARFELLVEVDPTYLEAATFPVTIDPGSQYVFGQGNDDTYVSSDAPDTDYRTSWLQVANGSVQKRAFVRFDTAPFQRDDRIVYGAELSLYVDSGPTGGPMVDAQRVTQAWPDPLTWNTQPTADSTVLDSANCTVCFGWMQFDVTDMYQHVLQTDIADPWTDHGIRASTDGSATYVFRSAESAGGPVLALVWNDLPSAPNLDKPATAYVSEDDTPTLKIEGGDQWPNDNNGDDVLVQFQISDDASDFSGSHIAWESPWIDTRSYVVPSGVLVDGQTYYWRARSWDICLENTYQMCSLTDGLGVDHERKTSNVRSFTVVLKHFGDDERWAMWEHALGNAMTLEVNEANGNLFLDVPLDSLPTPVGDLQVGLTYNSQQDPDYGLSRGWDVSIGAGGSMRDMPIELVKLSDYPHNGVKIRLRGGRLQYFPHRDHRVFATVTAGAGTVRENADGGFIFVSPAGDRYEFSQSGRLLGANPVGANLSSGQNSIRYTYDGQNQLEKVTDPLGRRVNLVWSGGKLESMNSWAGQSWDLVYNPTNGRLNEISIVVKQNAADPSSPTHTETIGFSYVVGALLPGGLLAEIDDGVTQVANPARAGWTVQYEEDANDNWRVAQLTPPPGGGPTPLESWHFQYLGDIMGSTAATACVTDPLGTPDTSPPIVCNAGNQTLVDFNWAGYPIRIAGPADQTGYWPVTTLIWDTNNNLLCRREPSANAVNEITGSNLCQSDKLSNIYTYEAEAPFRLLTETDPSPATDGSADRLKRTYQYDSDTNGANYNGLWIEKFENANLSGIPADESVWTNFDVNWGTGSPPGLTNTDNFSLRWTGLINTNNWSGSDLRKVFFRITSEEGVTLVIDNKVLLDCLGTTQAAGSYNCGTNLDVKKWLTPGSLHPITIEYSDLTGPASFKLEWKIDRYDIFFGPIPNSMLQTNLGLLTVEKLQEPLFSYWLDFFKTTYAFPDDNAKARHIPDTVAMTDLDTGVVRKTAFTYNSYGQVRTVTTAAATSLAATTTYTYTNADPISCLSSVEEPDAAISNHICNEAGDVTSSTRIVRAVPGTNHTTQQSRVTATEYDTLGRVTEVTTPWGGSATTTYDLAGRPLTIDQLLGAGAGHDTHAYTTYEYDDAGHLVKETLPEVANPANPGSEISPVIQHVYDWLDDEVRTIDQRGKEWDFIYDAYRRLIQSESPSGVIAQNEFRLRDGASYKHQMTTWTPPGTSSGVPTVTSYDVLGRTTSTKTGSLNPSTFLYDLQSRMTRGTEPSGVYTSYTYNRFGDVLTIKELSNAVTTTNTYDAAGRLQKVDGPRSSPTDDSISYVYDSQGRLITATQNGITLPGAGSPGVTTTYTWNDADERIKVTQPLSTTLTMLRNWMFDPTNRVSSYVDTAGTTTSTHDISGMVTSVADPRGITLKLEYDNQGRRTRRYAQQGMTVLNDQTYSYDLAGNQLTAKVVATATTITAEFDDDGRPWKVYQNASQPTTTYAYNASTGRLSSIVDPAGTTSFGYDANGLLNDITDPFSATHVVYTYDTSGRITKRTDGSGLCWSQTYESGSGRPDVRTIRLPGSGCNGTVRGTFDLGYDAASNVTTRAETITGNTFGGTYTYTYDAADRLLTATGPSAFGSRTYAHDGAGNRTSVQVGTGTPVTTTYNAAGLPTSSSDGTTYTHDQIGNLTSINRTGNKNDWFFTYHAWSGLTKAARTSNGSDVTYALDALDRQLSRTAGGSTASYTYQGTGEVLAKAQVGATTTTYASTPGGPLAQKSGTTTRYYLRDQHGDLVGWSDTTGALVGTALYDPWGQTLSATGELATVPTQGGFRFQSDLTDASTGQVEMLTRMYEPTLGRFSSRDVIFGVDTSPTSLNQFAYGLDNPLTYTDPSGLSPLQGTTSEGENRAETVAMWMDTNPGSCTTCTPAVGIPNPQPPAIAYARIMFNEERSLEQRVDAANFIWNNYGEDGREIVENWVAAMRLESETSTWSQITAHPVGSWKAGAQYLRERGITTNMSACFIVCVTFGTNGLSVSGFSTGAGGGSPKVAFGLSAYVTVGAPPGKSTVGGMYCNIACAGAYHNLDGSGGGDQFGVGTPGLFIGPGYNLP